MILQPRGGHLPEYTDVRLNRRETSTMAITGIGIPLRRSETPAGKHSSLPTPLSKWKFHESPASNCRRAFRLWVRDDRDRKGSVSARKLAARLWRLSRVTEFSSDGRGRAPQSRSSHRLGFERDTRQVKIAFPRQPGSKECGNKRDDLPQNTLSVCGPRNGIVSKVERLFAFSNSAMEGAAKSDRRCQKTSDESYHFHSQMKALNNQHVTVVSIVSAMQEELMKARARIHELETERQSFKNKIEHFLTMQHKEKRSWQRREQQKIRMVVDDLKNELNTEREICQGMQIGNTKLVNQLADAKLSAKQCLREYEKKRKSRVLMEGVCNELVKEIAEDKAEVEALKKESIKIHDEMEEERKMLQMAEIWREERVQMKLVDAKFTLENKYNRLNELIADLEDFLESRTATSSDAMELRKTELIRQAANLVRIHDVGEFSYAAPKSYDIFSIVKELQNGEANEIEPEPQLCVDSHPPANSDSKFCIVSPDVDVLDKNSGYNKHSVGFIICDSSGLEEEASGLETVTHDDNQGSVYSPEWSRMERYENAGLYSPKTEISDVCSVSTRQLSEKASFASKIWKSFPRNGVINEIISDEANRTFSNGTICNVENISPDRNSVEGGTCLHDSVVEPMAQGVEECLEQPQGSQKNTLKAKLWEARMEARKLQLRHVLVQKG